MQAINPEEVTDSDLGDINRATITMKELFDIWKSKNQDSQIDNITDWK